MSEPNASKPERTPDSTIFQLTSEHPCTTGQERMHWKATGRPAKKVMPWTVRFPGLFVVCLNMYRVKAMYPQHPPNVSWCFIVLHHFPASNVEDRKETWRMISDVYSSFFPCIVMFGFYQITVQLSSKEMILSGDFLYLHFWWINRSDCCWLFVCLTKKRMI